MRILPVSRYANSKLPTPFGEFTIYVYRTGEQAGLGASAVGLGPEEHVAIVLGDVAGDDVLVRVHSSCFTGEVLGSQRCDCRAQLDTALAMIAKEGRGAVIYLVQEGRGIGLGNKIRAYALQDQGADTVDANLAIGFDVDHRNYQVAAAMARDLGMTSVRLLTNNPDKIKGLAANGLPVNGNVPIWVAPSEHSASYLEVKKDKLGHLK